MPRLCHKQLFFASLLPLDDLTLKGPLRFQYHGIDLPVRVAHHNHPDLFESLPDTVIYIKAVYELVECLTSPQPVDHTPQCAYNIFLDGPDLSPVGITQSKTFTLDGKPGVVWFWILECQDGSPAPVIGRVEDVPYDNI